MGQALEKNGRVLGEARESQGKGEEREEEESSMSFEKRQELQKRRGNSVDKLVSLMPNYQDGP